MASVVRLAKEIRAVAKLDPFFEPKIRSLRAVKEARSVPNVYERMSCGKAFFSGAGTERLARV
jgi:hypothetical protein